MTIILNKKLVFKKMKKINYNKHFLDASDYKSLLSAAKSENITQGKYVKKFENDLKSYCNANYCITTNSASTALYLCVKSILIKEKNIDKICYISPNTYAATANCILLNNLKVRFIDIDKSLNMSAEKLEEVLKKRKKTKNKSIVIVTHFAGNPCDLKKFKILSVKYNLIIIEDAAHAFGSVYNKMKIGNGKYSDYTVVSFHPVKTITTAEGGAIFVNDKSTYEILDHLRSNGIKKGKFFQKKYYDQIYTSLNFRLSDLHAALGISQLKKIKRFINYRNNIATTYKKGINNKIIDFQYINKNSLSSFHLFVIRMKNIKFNQKIKLMKKAAKAGINFHNLYIPIFHFKLYENYSHKCPNVERFYNDSICLPIFYKLKNTTIKKIVKFLNEFKN
tara:strand:- start:642 stop:1817 length:1176 start_codon:yes stop_codon:yes gene_type:complete